MCARLARSIPSYGSAVIAGLSLYHTVAMRALLADTADAATVT